MRIRILLGILGISTVALTLASSAPAAADQLLGQYFSIQRSLASDSVSGVQAAAVQIAKLSRQEAATQAAERAQLLALAGSASKLNASNLKAARTGFGDLSDKLIAYLKASKAKRNPPFQFYCSMAKKNWLQPDNAVRNPYYGSAMPTCGELVK
jgi:hypothetical protein